MFCGITILCSLLVLNVPGESAVSKAPPNFPLTAWEYIVNHNEDLRGSNFRPWANKDKTKNKTAVDQHIVGGVPVDIANYPYQASMQVNGRHICGGSLIHVQWVLTASHCVVAAANVTKFRLGSTNRTTGGSLLAATTIFQPSGWNENTLDFDAALYKLAKAATLGSKIAIIPLPASTYVIAPGTNTTVSGWGTLKSGATSIPTILMAVSIPIVSKESCITSYGAGSITDTMICAGLKNGTKDSCQGDSGGPLVATVNGVTTLVGIVSWGIGCALPNYPGVYTNVASLRTWIQTTTTVNV